MTNTTLDSARRLADHLITRSEEIEAARRVPDDIVTTLRQEGIFRSCVPRALGGLEARPLDTPRAIEEIARADGSTGWVVMVGCTTALLSGYLDEHWSQHIMVGPPTGENHMTTPGNTRPRPHL